MNWRKGISYIKATTGISHGSRAFGGPVQALISVTNRCNIRCIHCYFRSPYLKRPNLIMLKRDRKTPQEPLTDENLKKLMKLDANTNRTLSLIDELIELGTTRFHICGSGEPFLHKNILDFFAHVKRSNCTCSTNTAGHMFNYDNIEFLIQIGFDELRITPMAGSPEVYMHTHLGVKDTTFRNIKENLHYLSKRKRELGLRKPKVLLCCIVISQNHDSLFEFAEFASSVNADRIMYHPVDDVGDPGLSKIVPSKEEDSKIRKQLVDVKSYLESKGIEHNIDNFLESFNTKLDTLHLYRNIPCYYGWLSVRIEVDGEVNPCCRCYRSFGNIYEQSFSEIWFGDTYRKFRKEAITLNKRKKPVTDCDCYSCANYNANLRVYKLLHPIKSRRVRFDKAYQNLISEIDL